MEGRSRVSASNTSGISLIRVTHGAFVEIMSNSHRGEIKFPALWHKGVAGPSDAEGKGRKVERERSS